MFPSNVLNSSLGSAGSFARQSIPGSGVDFPSQVANSYFNQRSSNASGNSLNSLSFRDLTGLSPCETDISAVSSPGQSNRGLDQLGGTKDTLGGVATTTLAGQQHVGFLVDHQRNGTTSLSSQPSTCRGQSSQSAGMGGETLLSDAEFPTLARPANLGANIGNNMSMTFPIMPTTSGYQTSIGLYSKDVISALQRAPYANLMKSVENSTLSPSVEFHIQNEDFPALPGAALLENSVHPTSFNQGQSGSASRHQAVDGMTIDSRYREASVLNLHPKSGIQTHPDGRVTCIPAGMLNDQFGMAGLLSFLRAIENDPNIVSLALGNDLTTLGLNLNAPERNLYSTFGGPWADCPCRTQDIDVKVPDEYLTNAAIRDKLPNIKLNKLSEDVLFYLFYNCPGEVYQMASACELYSRDWRFHKGETVWLTRSQYGGVKEQTGLYETGTYNVFDPAQWRKIPKEMTLEYKQLEERPKLPSQLTSSSQSAPGAPLVS